VILVGPVAPLALPASFSRFRAVPRRSRQPPLPRNFE
jgi:hypothetical protein